VQVDDVVATILFAARRDLNTAQTGGGKALDARKR